MPRAACAPLISASQFEVTPQFGTTHSSAGAVSGRADSGHPRPSRRLRSV